MEAKNYINPYDEVKNSLFVSRVKLAGYERDLKRIIDMAGPKPVKAQQYDAPITSGKIENVNDLYKLIVDTQKAIEDTKIEIEDLKNKKNLIEKNFIKTCLNETERKVFLLKQNKARYSCGDIAYKLNVTEGYIKVVVYTINKKMFEWTKNLQINEIIF